MPLAYAWGIEVRFTWRYVPPVRYFRFLGLYTRWLVAPAVVGVLCYGYQLVAGEKDCALPALNLFTLRIS
eukprot:COSAG05_NODE_2312_length_3243_cov_2.859097_5_plen_70_part_00